MNWLGTLAVVSVAFSAGFAFGCFWIGMGTDEW